MRCSVWEWNLRPIDRLCDAGEVESADYVPCRVGFSFWFERVHNIDILLQFYCYFQSIKMSEII